MKPITVVFQDVFPAFGFVHSEQSSKPLRVYAPANAPHTRVIQDVQYYEANLDKKFGWWSEFGSSRVFRLEVKREKKEVEVAQSAQAQTRVHICHRLFEDVFPSGCVYYSLRNGHIVALSPESPDYKFFCAMDYTRPVWRDYLFTNNLLDVPFWVVFRPYILFNRSATELITF